MSILHIHFEPDAGAADRESLARFRQAIDRAERGETVNAEEHVSFESIEGLFAMLTPKRLDLLRHLHAVPTRSVKALAEALARDYRRVHDDVAALASIGLIQREGTALRAPYGEIRFAFSLGAHPAAA